MLSLVAHYNLFSQNLDSYAHLLKESKTKDSWKFEPVMTIHLIRSCVLSAVLIA